MNYPKGEALNIDDTVKDVMSLYLGNNADTCYATFIWVALAITVSDR